MLLFHAMTEKSVILHEEITWLQADTVSVVASARTQFAISINLYMPLKKNFLWIWARRVRESGWSSGIACCWRSWRNWWRCGKGQSSKVRVSMLFLVLLRWRSQGLSCMVSFSQKLSEGEGLERHTSSEGVIGTARPPQCEFSNLHTSLAFGLLE